MATSFKIGFSSTSQFGGGRRIAPTQESTQSAERNIRAIIARAKYSVNLKRRTLPELKQPTKPKRGTSRQQWIIMKTRSGEYFSLPYNEDMSIDDQISNTIQAYIDAQLYGETVDWYEEGKDVRYQIRSANEKVSVWKKTNVQYNLTNFGE